MTTSASFRLRIERMLGVENQSKPAVYLQMFDASQIMSLNYTLELLLSAGIATFGLVLDSPAVVIGAMLISPLMGPILAAGLALAAADLYMGIRSLLSILFGVTVAVLFAAFIEWLLPFQSPTHEIVARTNPNLLDLGVALLSGIAGAVVVCRGGGGGGVTALPGVAIAVALMPPLCTVGFGIGSGFSGPIMMGAGLLFLTNLAAIIASAFLVFYLVRMDAADVRAAIDGAILERESHERLYTFSKRIGITGAYGDIGKLRWRILMLVAVLVILFVPLRKSLLQVRDETIARAAVGDAIRLLSPSDAIVARDVEPTANPIIISLIVTTTVPQETISEAEKMVLRRTGRDVKISVRKVASDEELAQLRQNIARPAPVPLDLASIRADLTARLANPLKEIWPADTAPLLSSEIGFDADSTVIRLSYQAARPLDPTAEQIISNLLKARLKIANLRLILDQQKPPPPPRQTGRKR